jgi:SAM-dependent methyltransferase
LSLSGDTQRKSFFGDAGLDVSLPTANSVFWAALLAHIEEEILRAPAAILDLGCHSGGLLAVLGKRFPQARLIGIEPVAALRAAAAARLSAEALRTSFLVGDSGWQGVRNASVDLMVCHEVLYLMPDLSAVMENVARILAPGGTGWVVLGCHSENPVWPRWKAQLVEDGLQAYDHSPFDLLAAAVRAGLVADVQPLRRTGWIRYDPSAAVFAFRDAHSMLDHHYRHKLLFRLRHSEDDDFASTS